MTYNTILFSQDGNVGIIKLNRPERMNAVIEEMYLEIQDVLGICLKDKGIRALILTGSILERNGEKKQAFCAGADLKEHAKGERTMEQKRDYLVLAHETTGQLFNFPKPVIASINGPARGAGAEMAMSCDFIIMAEEATIAFPETGLGTFVGGGVTHILPRIVGLSRAKYLIYSGKILNGIEAVEKGVALRCFPIETLFEETMRFASNLAEKAPVSMALAKKYLYESAFSDFQTVLENETEAIISCMETEDWQEGVDAFSEKRKPEYRGR